MTNLSKSISYLEKAIRNEYKEDTVLKNLSKALDILRTVEKRPITLLKLEKIASTYHDRDIFAGVTLPRDCPICEKHVHSTVCIESDTKDYSNDLYICADCI